MKSYSEAKKGIKSGGGYAHVTGDSAILADCECLDTFFMVRAMGRPGKKIYDWAQKHRINVREVLQYAHKRDGNEWTVWNMIFDDKPFIPSNP